MNKYSVLLISLLAAVLASCASTSIPDPEPSVENDDAGSSSGAYDADGAGGGEAIPDDASAELGTVVYFDYDKAELKPEYVDLLAQHADRLSDSGRISVRLEGHADERGSREYNVGLGERRSQAVRRILAAQGVSADQLSTVSFGEERPAVSGNDERSYALNRRVEIRYLN
jgi:peptidoglycan-associated lipoprotein